MLAESWRNSTTVYLKIAKFSTDIHADLVYSHTRYDITYYWV